MHMENEALRQTGVQRRLDRGTQTGAERSARTNASQVSQAGSPSAIASVRRGRSSAAKIGSSSALASQRPDAFTHSTPSTLTDVLPPAA
jgi:hypothetical protein